MKKKTDEPADEVPSAGTFSETVRALEEILARIEGEQIDIDELASELRRATVLLEQARNKIRKAEVEVSQIVQVLEKGDGERDAEG